MPVNTIQVSRRTMPFDSRIDANGSYTLPQYAFIPHPALQQLSSGMVQSPGAGGQSAGFVQPVAISQRPYPVSPMAATWGIRLQKQSP